MVCTWHPASFSLPILSTPVVTSVPSLPQVPFSWHNAASPFEGIHRQILITRALSRFVGCDPSCLPDPLTPQLLLQSCRMSLLRTFNIHGVVCNAKCTLDAPPRTILELAGRSAPQRAGEHKCKTYLFVLLRTYLCVPETIVGHGASEQHHCGQ